MIKTIRLTGVVVGCDHFDAQIIDGSSIAQAQVVALHRALVKRLPDAPESSISDSSLSILESHKYDVDSYVNKNQKSSLCILTSSIEFSSGKCASEYTHYIALNSSKNVDVSEPEIEKRKHLIQPKHKSDVVSATILTPHDLSMNWIIHTGHREVRGRSSTIKPAGNGTVEITLSRVGIPQGASLVSKIKPKKSHNNSNKDERANSSTDTSLSGTVPMHKVTSANNASLLRMKGELSHPVSRLCQRYQCNHQCNQCNN